jgi:formylglycine-generating enzyme required for sulfatase activity
MVLATVSGACGGEGTMTPAVPDQVSVSASATTVPVGGQVQLSAAVRARGNALPGGVSGWTSSNPAVATVNGSGTVTGVSRGSVTVSANAGGVQGTASLVVAGVRSVTVPAVSLALGESATVTAAVDADPGVGTVAVTWSSSNPSVATVSSTGSTTARVTAVAAGTATLQAVALGGVQGSATVVVTAPAAITECRWPSPTLDLAPGQAVTVTPVVTRANSAVAVTYGYNSSTPSVATVTGAGVVTGVAPGSATLTLTCTGSGTGFGTTTLTATAAATVRLVPVAAVSVSPAAASLVVGATQQLTASARDASGNALTGRAVSWTSSAASVATVSAQGVVTAVAAGTSTITATVEGVTGSATVTVATAPVAAVTVSPVTTTLVVGGTQQLTASARDAAGNALTGRQVTWASSAPAVATVSTLGVVTAVAAGSATITATVEGVNGTAAVLVTQVPVASVSVSPATASLAVGGTQALTASARDASGNALTGRPVSWTSSATAVATVSAAGVVTAVAAGTATITATVEGISNTAVITVIAVPPAISGFTVSPTTGSLLAGRTLALTPAETRANAGVSVSYAYQTSAPTVATVSVAGVILGVAPGTAVITVRATGTGTGTTTTTLTATVSVSVVAGFTFVRVEPGSFQMGSTNGDTDEVPVRTVTITRAFGMQTTEVTQGQWASVMGTSPSFFTACGASCPVERVSWEDVQTFLTRLNEQEPGKGYRLPTEAEWEYAARAGTTGDFGGNGNLNDMGWWTGNSTGRTWPAQGKQANAWGLFDMHGNVWEWVADWYGSYAGQSTVDPSGPATGTLRVLRGGAFGSGLPVARSAFRQETAATYRNADAGFRLVRNP